MKIKIFLALQLSDAVFILLINVKMPATFTLMHLKPLIESHVSVCLQFTVRY